MVAVGGEVIDVLRPVVAAQVCVEHILAGTDTNDHIVFYSRVLGVNIRHLAGLPVGHFPAAGIARKKYLAVLERQSAIVVKDVSAHGDPGRIDQLNASAGAEGAVLHGDGAFIRLELKIANKVPDQLGIINRYVHVVGIEPEPLRGVIVGFLADDICRMGAHELGAALSEVIQAYLRSTPVVVVGFIVLPQQVQVFVAVKAGTAIVVADSVFYCDIGAVIHTQAAPVVPLSALSESTRIFVLLPTVAPVLFMHDAACWKTSPRNTRLLAPSTERVALRAEIST